jgi:hypothetical protein
MFFRGIVQGKYLADFRIVTEILLLVRIKKGPNNHTHFFRLGKQLIVAER